jgi:hypothetical protein
MGSIINKRKCLRALQLGHHLFLKFVEINPLLSRLLSQTRTLMICSHWHRNLHNDWCQWNRVLDLVLFCHYWKIWAICFLESSPSLLGTCRIWLDPRSCIITASNLVWSGRESCFRHNHTVWTIWSRSDFHVLTLVNQAKTWVVQSWYMTVQMSEREYRIFYQFMLNDCALSAANWSAVELLNGSNQSMCTTMPISPPCSA